MLSYIYMGTSSRYVNSLTQYAFVCTYNILCNIALYRRVVQAYVIKLAIKMPLFAP